MTIKNKLSRELLDRFPYCGAAKEELREAARFYFSDFDMAQRRIFSNVLQNGVGPTINALEENPSQFGKVRWQYTWRLAVWEHTFFALFSVLLSEELVRFEKIQSALRRFQYEDAKQVSPLLAEPKNRKDP